MSFVNLISYPYSPKNVVKGWDKAKLLPPDGETQAFEDEVCYLHLLKALKVDHSFAHESSS